jgi:hypothetical protein
MFWQAASGLVGLVFLGTGALKAVDSVKFLEQVGRYRLLPPAWVLPAAVLFIAVECALGTALLLGLSPWLLPAAALLLVAFAALTAWATSTGRVEDCGCYGGLVLLTPAQSLALDGLYVALLAGAWGMAPADTFAPAAWKLVVVLVAAAVALAASWRSLRTPLVDLSLLRVGRTWRRSWLKRYARDVTQGSHFVVFLSRDCPYCKRWVPLLNVIEVQPDLPSVVAVMSLQGEELQGFLQEHLIAFPVTHMPQSLVSLMVTGYPTAALVENGRIAEKWVGEMPQSYMDRVRGFFEAIKVPVKPARGGFAG